MHPAAASESKSGYCRTSNTSNKVHPTFAAPVSRAAPWEVPVVVLDVVGEADDVLDATALCRAVCLRHDIDGIEERQ